ncbi:MAG: TlpA family protein disulfide reductase [Alphaproteobacteria bacterium]|nr:TlpA family protein disulfide reductase [Alphaproteobacteria bacterium]
MLLAAATRAAADDQMKLGEFIPANPAQPAPDVTFTNMNGAPLHFTDFKGKPVVVNLWATWCQPCLREMPSLERLQSKLEGKLTVAAISEDRGGAKIVEPFLGENHIQTVKVFLDPKSEVGHAFKTRGLPTSIVIDAKGNVVGEIEGPTEWDGPKMMSVLRPLLGGLATLQNAAR